ncbi:Os10g0479700, partial [Oryza sativa Japonica Group]
QMTKLAIIPFTMLLETIFLSKKFSRSIKISLMVLLLGVGIASVTDLQLNLLGSIIAVLTIAATCVSQILTNQIQRRLKVSSTQLLYQSSPYQSAVLLVTGPFVDKLLTNRDVFAFTYTFQVVAFIVLSCSIAVCVNFSTFLVIGTTSPVTYQVLGHLKTCLILSFGYVLLRDPFTFRNVAGILVAIFGMGLYSFFSVSESRDKKLADGPSPPLPISSSQMAEMKDSEPLLGGGGGAAAKSSPWNEVKGLQSFDEVPRTAKSAFSRP